jgi:stringent starvation protein B
VTNFKTTSTKPYVLRAFYDWIVDNHLTPYVAVDTRINGVLLPPELAHQKEVIFNIDSTAAVGLSLGRHHIEFTARFSGISRHVRFPINAVLGLYAKENGYGVLFLEDGSLSIIDEPDSNIPAEAPPAPSSDQGRRKPHLHVVGKANPSKDSDT